jgi:hypothetical protein
MLRSRMLCVAVLASVAAGCSASGGNRRQADVTPQPAALATDLNPFASYIYEAPSEVVRLEIAHERLIAACMRERGFTFTPAVSAVPTDDAVSATSYALIDAGTARAQGYGIADNYDVSQAAASAGSRPQRDQDRPGYIAALAGTEAHHVKLVLPEGHTVSYNSNGCVSVALTRLYGPDWNKVYYTVNDLASKVVYEVSHTPKWVTATKAWTRCMKARTGHSFDQPEQARAEVETRIDSTMKATPPAQRPQRLRALRSAEVTAAEIDASCESSSGLWDAVVTEQPRAESSYEVRYSGLLHAYRKDLAHARQYLRSQHI